MQHTEIIIDNQYHDFNPIQFGYETCKPSHAFGPAVRSHWLLHYVVSGCGIFIREGQNHSIYPGQIFVIPPYVETYYEADKDNPWQYIWIGFTTEGSTDVFSEPVLSSHAAGAIFDEMLSCGKLENGRSAFLAGCLWKLVSVLLERKESTVDYVEKALNYMHAEYPNRVTVQEIADRIGLDRSYFYTLFSEKVGTSPSRYLINLRLSKAVELMTVYGERPSTAAASVGYEDLYQFSKIFKKYFGVSPREYIRNALK